MFFFLCFCMLRVCPWTHTHLWIHFPESCTRPLAQPTEGGRWVELKTLDQRGRASASRRSWCPAEGFR